MSEISPSEVTPRDEVELAPEQQQVVDVMEREGKKLETAVLDAREKAAGQLKQLHGKELVDAGLKQMGHGVWETVKAEARGVVSGGLFGALVGGLGGGAIGALGGKDVPSVVKGGIAGGIIGGLGVATTAGFVDYELAGLRYNDAIAKKQGLPPVRWYDWAIAHIGFWNVPLLLGNFSFMQMPLLREFTRPIVMAQILNPITVAGIRHVATGLWQMRKG